MIYHIIVRFMRTGGRALLDFEETPKSKVHGRPVSSLRATGPESLPQDLQPLRTEVEQEF